MWTAPGPGSLAIAAREIIYTNSARHIFHIVVLLEKSHGVEIYGHSETRMPTDLPIYTKAFGWPEEESIVDREVA